MRQFLNDRVALFAGDCLDVLPTFDPDSFDAVVCDPPYHLGFMGKDWDRGSVAFDPATWAAVLRVVKPGGHLVAFAAPKNAHRLICAIEDAGFEIRDTIMWLFGSGFPKSLDVSKAIDKAAGAQREVVGRYQPPNGSIWNLSNDTARSEIGAIGHSHRATSLSVTAPATDDARRWQGWGTALKPAYEPIVLARKPLSEASVALNVLRWGTGALNIDGGRVGEGVRVTTGNGKRERKDGWGMQGGIIGGSDLGRWPANIIHDGSEEVLAGFPETGLSAGGTLKATPKFANQGGGASWRSKARDGPNGFGFGDTGSAARFFYTAKADAQDRAGSRHPTVKPIDLLQYLVRLVTPPGGKILDPFAGTGTTGEAAWREGFSATLIEREPDYCADIERRLQLCLSGPGERSRQIAKARQRGSEGHGPLFVEAAE